MRLRTLLLCIAVMSCVLAAGCASFQHANSSSSSLPDSATVDDLRAESERLRKSARRSLWGSIVSAVGSGALAFGYVQSDEDGSENKLLGISAVGAATVSWILMFDGMFQTIAADEVSERAMEKKLMELRQAEN